MKKLYAFLFCIICFSYSFSQTKTQSVLKWAGGSKEISKITDQSDTSSIYLFVFRNSKYTQLVDIKSVSIGSYTDYKIFVETLDSLLSKVEITKGESISYTVGNVKNVTLSTIMGKSMLTINDNEMLGYCYLGVADIRKLKTLQP